MDETVFVILLLTGFCIPCASFPNVFYFIREKMTWYDARYYCTSEHTEMAQILDMENVTTMMNTPTRGYADKAWIGLYENISEWTWVDGQVATYSSWGPDQPDNVNADEFCVFMTYNGSWMDNSCSEKKPAICFMDGLVGPTYTIVQTPMTWIEAKTYCEDKQSILATFNDEKTNSNIQKELEKVKEAWIGLSRPKLWYWSDTGENYRFINWQTEQPDNLYGEENCAAVVVKDGTWTDEQCNATYPFFCYGVYESWKTVVRIEIQSSTNMEDPAYTTDLKQQLYAVFINQGAVDFKLTWKKLPRRHERAVTITDAR